MIQVGIIKNQLAERRYVVNNGYHNSEDGKTIDFGDGEPWKEIFDIK